MIVFVVRFAFVCEDYRMLGKQAKTLASIDVADLLAFADCSRHPLRNRVIVLLSAKAGLRAGEIAGLTWDMVLDANGQIGTCIELRDHAAKKGSGRVIPMHPALADALISWRQVSFAMGPVVRSERGGPMTALSIVVGSNARISTLGWTDARPIPAAAPSLPALPASSTKPAGHYATFSC
jgi:integrase